MKKYLSLVLAFALILTTIILPTTASAAANGTISVVLSTDATGDVYAGDTVKLTAKAVANGADPISFDYASFYVSYDASKLTAAVGSDYSVVNKQGLDYLTYAYDDSTALQATTDGLELFTATFTVKDVNSGNPAFVIADKGGVMTPSFVVKAEPVQELYADCQGTSLTVGAREVKVSATPAAGTAIELSADTASFNDPDGFTVKPEVTTGTTTGVTAALYTVSGEGETLVEDVTLTIGEESAQITGAGTYRVKVTVPGVGVKEYNFVYTKAVIDAKIAFVSPIDYVKGYTHQKEINVPVRISGISDYTVAVASFEVVYDATKLNMDTAVDNTNKLIYSVDTDTAGSNAAKVTVTYGANDNSDGDKTEGSDIAVLKFSVKDKAAGFVYGDAPISLQGGTWAPVLQIISPEDKVLSALGTTTLNPAVIPPNLSDYATVPTFATDWCTDTNGYTVTLTDIPNGVEVKYIESADALETVVESTFNTAIELGQGNTVTVDDENANYYVVAKVGTTNPVYEILVTVTKGKDGTKLDTTAPEFSEYSDPINWTKTDSTDGIFTPAATDSNSGIKGYLFSVNNGDYSTEPAESYTVAKGTSLTSIRVKAVDVAGNTSVAEQFNVKFDGVKPTISKAEVGLTTANNEKEIVISASDDVSGIAKVEILKGSTDATGDNVEEILDATSNGVVTDYKYIAKQAMDYYVRVTDGAGLVSVSGAIKIDLTKIDATGILVAIKQGADPAAGFVGGGTNNGTFNYIKITKANEQDGCETTMTLQKTGADALGVAAEYELDANTGTTDATAVDEIAGEYTLTVTTKKIADPLNTGTQTYKFILKGKATEMKSADDNAYYNALDYAVMNNFTAGLSANQPNFPTVQNPGKFSAGYYSADVDGILGYTPEDTKAVIDAIRAGDFAGTYTFGIMNGILDALTNPFDSVE